MFSEDMLLSLLLLVAAAPWSTCSAARSLSSSTVFVRQVTLSSESFRRHIMRDVVSRALRMKRRTIMDRCLATSNGVWLPIDGDRARFPCLQRGRRCHSLDSQPPPPSPKTIMINNDRCCSILLVCYSLLLFAMSWMSEPNQQHTLLMPCAMYVQTKISVSRASLDRPGSL